MVEIRTKTSPKHVKTIFHKKYHFGPNYGCLNPNVYIRLFATDRKTHIYVFHSERVVCCTFRVLPYFPENDIQVFSVWY